MLDMLISLQDVFIMVMINSMTNKTNQILDCLTIVAFTVSQNMHLSLCRRICIVRLGGGLGNTLITNHSNIGSSTNATIIGLEAGNGATSITNSFFVGELAGQSATNADHSTFLGRGAGFNATEANYSNFIGVFAGSNATNADNSNFLGGSAGNGATNARNSNFIVSMM